MEIRATQKTVSQLRNFTALDVKYNPQVYILDANRQGFYTYDSTDTTTADDLGFTIVTTSGARYKRQIEDGKVRLNWFLNPNTGADAASTINTLVNTIGNKELVFEGTYDIKSVVNISRSNFVLKGEGRFSTLNISPTTTLASAFILQGFDNEISQIKFVCNSNTRVVLNYYGNGSRPKVSKCLFEGHDSKPSGQKAILINGNNVNAVYLVSVQTCDFNYFDTAVHFQNEAHGYVADCNFFQPNTGIQMQNAGGLSTIQGVFFQTPTNFAIRSYSSLNVYSDIQCESNTAPAIKFETGSNFNQYNNVVQTGSFTPIVDNGTQNVGKNDFNIRTGAIEFAPIYDIYAKNNSLFCNLGNANKLSWKNDVGSVTALT